MSWQWAVGSDSVCGFPNPNNAQRQLQQQQHRYPRTLERDLSLEYCTGSSSAEGILARAILRAYGLRMVLQRGDQGRCGGGCESREAVSSAPGGFVCPTYSDRMRRVWRDAAVAGAEGYGRLSPGKVSCRFFSFYFGTHYLPT